MNDLQKDILFCFEKAASLIEEGRPENKVSILFPWKLQLI